MSWRQSISLSLIVLLLTLHNHYAGAVTLNTRVKVPDNDATLNQLIDREALPQANSELNDAVYWVPSSTQYNAVRISTTNGPRTIHSNYGFQLLLQRSRCPISVYIPPDQVRKKCSPDNSQPEKRLYHVNLAWNNGDWSSVEMENYFTTPSGRFLQPGK